MSAPLTGLKVVELARILAGPWIGQTLADLAKLKNIIADSDILVENFKVGGLDKWVGL
jgi:crotonobetainyl-CoA:carnitine CoA-transferase CaiB-like acyl-CoA transferase